MDACTRLSLPVSARVDSSGSLRHQTSLIIPQIANYRFTSRAVPWSLPEAKNKTKQTTTTKGGGGEPVDRDRFDQFFVVDLFLSYPQLSLSNRRHPKYLCPPLYTQKLALWQSACYNSYELPVSFCVPSFCARV